MQKERIQLKQQGGSKAYPKRPSINAGGVFGYNPSRSDPEGRVLKVGGFDKLKVANKSNSDVEVQLGMNPKRALYIEAGTQEIFEDIQPFRSYKVVNLDNSNSIPAGKLTLSSKLKAMTADDQARYQQQKNQGLGIGDLAGIAKLI
jgi:hypothetical protein